MCHGPSLASGSLSLADFASAMKGAQAGPVILPGDADGSKLIAVQTSGGHPGQLLAEELAMVRAWIEAGAPEK